MAQEKGNVKEHEVIKIKVPKKYFVVFHNDDFTPMDFVVFVMMQFFYLSFVEADNLMMKVHLEGQASIGPYSLDIASSKKEKTMALAHEYGYPLRLSLKEE